MNYTEEERQKMLSKVVIAPAKIKLQKELDEIQKRKNEKAAQDALDQKRDQEMKSRMQKDNRVEEEQRLKQEQEKNR